MPAPKKPEATLPPIEIFRAGTFTASNGTTHTITAEQLQQIAADYSAAVGEAPLVVGHPKSNGPAYGWVEKLSMVGDKLVALPRDMCAEFAALLKAKRFKKRSASFFLPGSPGNPTPDRMYLRHVGFLGAAPPAVPGLADIEFAADADAITLEFDAAEPADFSGPWYALGAIAELLRNLRDRLIAETNVETADRVLPGYQIDTIERASDYTETTGNASRLAQFLAPETPDPATVARLAAIAARETALAERERVATRAACVEFADELMEQGRIKPGNHAAAVELLLDAELAPVDFSVDGETVPRVQLLRSLLSQGPVVVPVGPEIGAPPATAPVNFSAPAGCVVDDARLQLLSAAKQYQAAHPGTSLAAAVSACGG